MYIHVRELIVQPESIHAVIEELTVWLQEFAVMLRLILV